jgi:hypothetical protein
MPGNPFWHKRNNPYHNIESADTLGNSFQPRYISQQTPLAGSSYPRENRVIADTTSSFRPEALFQPPLPAALPNSLPHTIQQKLEELKILASKSNFP